MFSNKEELLSSLRLLTENPDDEIIRYKKKIKDTLLGCPELLYALNNKDYESELFLPNGDLFLDGDWSVYFGTSIRDFISFPESQSYVKNYLSYTVGFKEIPRYNLYEKIIQVTFYVFCDKHNITDNLTGIARHDLISSILRDVFNWSNIFGTQCKIVENFEGTTDSEYVTRTIILELTAPNSIVKTTGNKTITINNAVRR